MANNSSGNISIYTINQTTGALTATGTISARIGTGPGALAMLSGAKAVASVPANDGDNTMSLEEKPPFKIPFAVHKAGQIVKKVVVITDDRVYPFEMSFRFKKHDKIESNLS